MSRRTTKTTKQKYQGENKYNLVGFLNKLNDHEDKNGNKIPLFQLTIFKKEYWEKEYSEYKDVEDNKDTFLSNSICGGYVNPQSKQIEYLVEYSQYNPDRDLNIYFMTDDFKKKYVGTVYKFVEGKAINRKKGLKFD